MERYNFLQIEKKWRNKIYSTSVKKIKEKFSDDKFIFNTKDGYCL